MAILPTPNLDYTDKDFDSLRLRLYNLIASVFPTWTDANVANFGNILVELFAHVGDVLTFYQDNQANESRWTTARLRESMIALTKLIGFQPEGAKAAQVDVTITARDAATGGLPVGDVNIPAGTFVQTAEVTDPIVFQLLSTASIAAGTDPPEDTVTAEHSESHEDSFVSTELANQEITLSSTPYLDDSAIVVASDGAYTEVENFLSSTATDRHFRVVVNSADRALLRFGNGVNGKIPVGTIAVSYKTGGGEEGKIEEDTITQIPGSFRDSLGNQLVVTVTNASGSSGAQDRQTVEQIRAAAPEAVRVQERTVSREDFEIVARGVEGVARAFMATINEDPAIAENTGFLFVVPEGGGLPSQTLKDEIADLFDEDGDYPATLTFRVIVSDPLYKTVNVVATVFPEEGADLDPTSDGYLGDAIRDRLEDFFAIQDEDGQPNEQIKFGFFYKDSNGVSTSELPLSDVQNVVRDTPGVRKLSDRVEGFTLNGYHRDVELERREFPQLGTVTLINGDDLESL